MLKLVTRLPNEVRAREVPRAGEHSPMGSI
jgi:hypothetical protein